MGDRLLQVFEFFIERPPLRCLAVWRALSAETNTQATHELFGAATCHGNFRCATHLRRENVRFAHRRRAGRDATIAQIISPPAQSRPPSIPRTAATANPDRKRGSDRARTVLAATRR